MDFDDSSEEEFWPTWWRWALLAVGTLILCSCSANRSYVEPACPDPAAAAAMPICDAPLGEEPTGVAAEMGAALAATPQALMLTKDGIEAAPLPFQINGPWMPDGLTRPWPAEEYLRDGGDREFAAEVNDSFQVRGLETEDTIVHYDTIRGDRIVEPSNVVHLYAPRFGAVRKVTAAVSEDQVDGPIGLDLKQRLVRYDDIRGSKTVVEQQPLVAGVNARRAKTYESRSRDGAISTLLVPTEFQDALLPFENLSIIRHGCYQSSEKAMLAEGVQAAIAWTEVQAVQVVIDHQAANEVVGDARVQATFVSELPGHPMIRLVKVASTQFAKPGELVDFTLRYDNVGDEVIGNVTILDNLTARLEYVEGSAQASRPGKFATEPNDSGSVVLRWEVDDPLEPGEGGICRFTCRVR